MRFRASELPPAYDTEDKALNRRVAAEANGLLDDGLGRRRALSMGYTRALSESSRCVYPAAVRSGRWMVDEGRDGSGPMMFEAYELAVARARELAAEDDTQTLVFDAKGALVRRLRPGQAETPTRR